MLVTLGSALILKEVLSVVVAKDSQAMDCNAKVFNSHFLVSVYNHAYNYIYMYTG